MAVSVRASATWEGGEPAQAVSVAAVLPSERAWSAHPAACAAERSARRARDDRRVLGELRDHAADDDGVGEIAPRVV